jgi:glycerophosphoryl diester phosphodiesterase
MEKNLKIPKIIGHRGAKAFAPENTLASFRKAKELGAQWIEFDVKETQDGVLVVLHDHDLDRTTNAKGPIIEKSWKFIETLDAGSWFHPSFRGEKVPTLEEVFFLCEKLNLGANIEIKPCPGRDQKIATAVVQTVNQKWPSRLSPPLISSFSMEALRCVKKTNPHLMIGTLFEQLPNNWKSLAKEVQASTIHLDNDFFDSELLSDIIFDGYQVLVYTVNDQDRARELFKMGVCAVFTDSPWKI